MSNTYIGCHFNISTIFAKRPLRVYRCYGPFNVKPSGTWVVNRQVETQTPDVDANRFFGKQPLVLCGWGKNPGLLPSDPVTHCYIDPDRPRLIIGDCVVWEAKPADAPDAIERIAASHGIRLRMLPKEPATQWLARIWRYLISGKLPPTRK